MESAQSGEFPLSHIFLRSAEGAANELGLHEGAADDPLLDMCWQSAWQVTEPL